MKFDRRTNHRHIQTVNFVNCDTPTTTVFVAVYKSLDVCPAKSVEDSNAGKVDKDENADGYYSEHSDTWQNDRTSQSDDKADRQLQRSDVDTSTMYQNDAVPSESSAIDSSSSVATGSHVLVPNCSDPYRMVTSSGITIEIYCGNLVDEHVDAIVNPANSLLIHGGGAARAIAEAAGRQLQEQCKAYISEHKELKVTQAMHTTAGNMNPPVLYVIHVAGPSAREFPNRDDLYRAVVDTFYNCMLLANNSLHVSSLSIPAVCSGE